MIVGMTTATIPGPGPGSGTDDDPTTVRRGRTTVVRSVVFVVVALVAVYLAYWRIGQQNPYTDEITYTRAGWEYLHGIVTQNLEHPPTAKYLYGLAQYVFGTGVLGPRIVASTASLGIGVVLLLWLRRPLGWWGAQFAAALWWLTPRGDSATWMDVASGSAARIDRIGLLEPVMTFFGVLAVAAAWQWGARTRARARPRARSAGGAAAHWPWAALAGAALAASVTSKVTTAMLVLALVAVPLLFRRRSGTLLAAVVAAVSFAVLFVGTYLPVGGLRAIEYMLRFQDEHNVGGHEISVLGTTYDRAPWWTNGVYMAQGLGLPLLAVIAVGVVAAVLLRPGRLVALLGIAAASLMTFSATAHVALPHYYIVWMPFLVALAAVGYTRLARLRPPWTLVLAALVVVPVVVPAAQLAVAVSETRPAGLARLDAELRARGVGSDERLLFAGVSRPTFDVWFRGRAIMQYVTTGSYGVLVEGQDARFPLTGSLRALVRDDPAAFESFRVDDLRVWVPKDGRRIVVQGSRVTVAG